MSAKKSTSTRRAHDNTPAKAVIVYFPASHVTEIDRVAASKDLDRSKFIRAAVRRALGHA